MILLECGNVRKPKLENEIFWAVAVLAGITNKNLIDGNSVVEHIQNVLFCLINYSLIFLFQKLLEYNDVRFTTFKLSLF